MDIVPVIECRMPTVTSVSVTASPVVFTADVAGTSGRANFGSTAADERAAAPIRSPRRVGLRRFPVIFSEDIDASIQQMGFGHRDEWNSPLKSKTAPEYCGAAYVD